MENKSALSPECRLNVVPRLELSRFIASENAARPAAFKPVPRSFSKLLWGDVLIVKSASNCSLYCSLILLRPPLAIFSKERLYPLEYRRQRRQPLLAPARQGWCLPSRWLHGYCCSPLFSLSIHAKFGCLGRVNRVNGRVVHRSLFVLLAAKNLAPTTAARERQA